jgi:hypothetical protein
MRHLISQQSSTHNWFVWGLTLILSVSGALLLAILGPLGGLVITGALLFLLISGVFLYGLRLQQLLFILIAGLPLHTFVMMVLYGRLGLPAGIISALSVWKELLVLVASLVFIIRALPSVLRQKLRFTLIDIFALLLTIWISGHILWDNLLGTAVPPLAQAYGLRFYAIPLVLYAIGRLAPLKTLQRERCYWLLALLGGVTGGLAIIEMVMPDILFIELLRMLGYHAYFTDYVTGGAMWGPGGTAASMWVYIGGRFVRRAGSIYMLSKPYAFTYLLILPVMLALLWTEPRRDLRRWLWLSVIVSLIGIVLTGTRALLLVGPLIFVAMAFLLRRWWAWFIACSIGLLGAIGLLLLPVVQDYVIRMFTGQDSSTNLHLSGWIKGLTNGNIPWLSGIGIGTANQENLRLNLDPARYQLGVISESIYVQAIQEIGVIGLGIYLLLMLAIIQRANCLINTGERHAFRTGQIMRWSTIAILVVSVVALPWQGTPITTYFFWILAGQLAQMQIHLPMPEESQEIG